MPLSLVPPFRPVVDGYFLPDTPERLAVKGPVNAKYFLTGATQDEGVIAGRSPTGYCIEPCSAYRIFSSAKTLVMKGSLWR